MTKAVLPAGTLARLDRLISRAQKVSTELSATGREIATQLRAATHAINSMQQMKLAISDRPPKRKRSA